MGIVFIDIKPGLKIIASLVSYCLQYKENISSTEQRQQNVPKVPFFPSSIAVEPPDFKQGTFLKIRTTFPSFPSTAR